MKKVMALLMILLTIFNIAIIFKSNEITATKTATSTNNLIICDRTDYASIVHCETNYIRAENKKHTLAYSSTLEAISKEKSEDMCDRNYFSHDYEGRSWTYYINKSGITYTNAGENLAKGFNSPQKSVEALVNSPKHFDNIVGDYTHLGVYTSSCNGINYTTQTFAKL